MTKPIELPTADPISVGMSADRLARINPAMQAYVDAQKIPGAVTLVARHGKVVHFDSVGYQDVEQGVPWLKIPFFG